MPIGGISGSIWVMIEGKIIEALIESSIDNTKKILIVSLLDETKDADKVAIAKEPKKEVYIWLSY